MGKLEDLQIRQLDDALAPFQGLKHRPPPESGWIKTIRETLGLTVRKLAERAGTSKTAMNNAELTEAQRTIRLSTLQRIADAMDCDFVYALVPRESLQRTIEKQAARVAQERVGRVADSMDLENQGVPDAERQRRIGEMVDDILRNRGADFWDV